MAQIDREFDYKPPAGPLKLAGALTMILGPIVIWQSMSGDVGQIQFGRRLWWITVSGALAPYALGAIGVVCILAGYFMLKGGIQMSKRTGRIAFMPHFFLVSATKDNTDGAIRYEHLSKITVKEMGSRGILSYWHKDGRFEIDSRNMNAREDFEEMSAMLKERVELAEEPTVVSG